MTLRPLNPFRPFEPFRYGVRSITAAIRALFANGEQGWWYDPSDLSTLYQDAAGTTPVTAMEQFVGLILDKSKGLQLGPELVTNGDFSQGATGWILGTGWNVANGMATKTAGAAATIRQGYAFQAGKAYSITYEVSGRTAGQCAAVIVGGTSVGESLHSSNGVRRCIVFAAAGNNSVGISADGIFDGSINNISVRELPGNHGFQSTLTKRMKVSRRVNLLVGTSTLATQSITTVAGAHTFKFSGAGSVTLSGTATGTYSAGAHSITCTAGTLTVTVTGAVTDASFVPTIKAHLPYQLVNTATDYDDDPSKFPTYFKPDAIDDCYVTNDIDLTGTDKVNVWAGITKLSDAAAAMVLELSPAADANNGAISLRAPSAATPNAQFISKGTAAYVAAIASPLAAPINAILGGVGDIDGDVAAILVNGVEVARSTADQGTGNYGKHPLFIGARNQTALFFGGEIYSLIGRGALSNASQQAAVNQYIRQKMMLP